MVLVVIYSSGGSSAGGVGREEPDAYRRRRERSKLRRLFLSVFCGDERERVFREKVSRMSRGRVRRWIGSGFGARWSLPARVASVLKRFHGFTN